MQPTPLWVNLHFFMMCIYKHCFLPMLLVFAMKCCTKIMPCPLPHNDYYYCCLLPSPACLSHLLICTSSCLISSPIACPPSCVLCRCLSCFVFFGLCYISLWLHFGLFVYIFFISFLFLSHSMPLLHFCIVTWWFFHAIYVSDLIPLPQIVDGVGIMKHVCLFVVLFLGKPFMLKYFFGLYTAMVV